MADGGIKCPNPECGAVEDYKGGQNKKIDNGIERLKICNKCGHTFKTLEVPLGLVEVKRRAPKSTQE